MILSFKFDVKLITWYSLSRVLSHNCSPRYLDLNICIQIQISITRVLLLTDLIEIWIAEIFYKTAEYKFNHRIKFCPFGVSLSSCTRTLRCESILSLRGSEKNTNHEKGTLVRCVFVKKICQLPWRRRVEGKRERFTILAGLERDEGLRKLRALKKWNGAWWESKRECNYELYFMHCRDSCASQLTPLRPWNNRNKKVYRCRGVLVDANVSYGKLSAGGITCY